jgi:hypothetical protein
VNRQQWGDVAFKSILGAVFFFILQFTVLKANLPTSLFWSAALGVGAGLLAWSQHRRGG